MLNMKSPMYSSYNNVLIKKEKDLFLQDFSPYNKNDLKARKQNHDQIDGYYSFSFHTKSSSREVSERCFESQHCSYHE